MRVVAEVLTGKLFYIEIENDATVADLKLKIGDQEQLPQDRLILMLDAGPCHVVMDQNRASLTHYGVQDGSHVYVFFGPLGDGSSIDVPLTPLDLEGKFLYESGFGR